jgi:hypothetical protein
MGAFDCTISARFSPSRVCFPKGFSPKFSAQFRYNSVNLPYNFRGFGRERTFRRRRPAFRAHSGSLEAFGNLKLILQVYVNVFSFIWCLHDPNVKLVTLKLIHATKEGGGHCCELHFFFENAEFPVIWTHRCTNLS